MTAQDRLNELIGSDAASQPLEMRRPKNRRDMFRDELRRSIPPTSQKMLEDLLGLLPMAQDIKNRFENIGKDGGIYTTIFDDEEDPTGHKNGESIAHLAQFANDTGYNEALTEVRAVLERYFGREG